MSQDEELTKERLIAIWLDERIPTLPLEECKYAMISDVHLGNGGGADNFRDNEAGLVAALEYYSAGGFSIMLLGDIEEFWQFDPYEIEGRYRDTVYRVLRSFGDDRIHRIFGNHDDRWCSPLDPIKNQPYRLGIATEAIKLTWDNHPRILLLHGHQGNIESDRYSALSRIPVRIYRYIEGPINSIKKFLGTYRQLSTMSKIRKDYERIMYTWAKDNNVILICGHSHRAIFASLSFAERLQKRNKRLEHKLKRKNEKASLDILEDIKDKMKVIKKDLQREKRRNMIIESVEKSGDVLPRYFNTGCALYSEGLTAIEIVDNEIRLVKWDRDPEAAEPRKVYNHTKLEAVLKDVISS